MQICLQQVEFISIRTSLCFLLKASANCYLKKTNQIVSTGSGGVLPRLKRRGSLAEVTMSQNEPWNLKTKQSFNQKPLPENIIKRYLFWQLLLFLNSRRLDAYSFFLPRCHLGGCWYHLATGPSYFRMPTAKMESLWSNWWLSIALNLIRHATAINVQVCLSKKLW